VCTKNAQQSVSIEEFASSTETEKEGTTSIVIESEKLGRVVVEIFHGVSPQKIAKRMVGG
jgi:hypothetical protein